MNVQKKNASSKVKEMGKKGKSMASDESELCLWKIEEKKKKRIRRMGDNGHQRGNPEERQFRGREGGVTLRIS